MFTLKAGWTKQRVMEQIKKYNNGTRAMLAAAGNICTYQAPDGNRCAIGCFIPDGHPALKSPAYASQLIRDFSNLKKYMPFEDPKALDYFQRSHDRAPVGTQVHCYIEMFLNDECVEAV